MREYEDANCINLLKKYSDLGRAPFFRSRSSSPSSSACGRRYRIQLCSKTRLDIDLGQWTKQFISQASLASVHFETHALDSDQVTSFRQKSEAAEILVINPETEKISEQNLRDFQVQMGQQNATDTKRSSSVCDCKDLDIAAQMNEEDPRQRNL